MVCACVRTSSPQGAFDRKGHGVRLTACNEDWVVVRRVDDAAVTILTHTESEIPFRVSLNAEGTLKNKPQIYPNSWVQNWVSS